MCGGCHITKPASNNEIAVNQPCHEIRMILIKASWKKISQNGRITFSVITVLSQISLYESIQPLQALHRPSMLYDPNLFSLVLLSIFWEVRRVRQTNSHEEGASTSPPSRSPPDLHHSCDLYDLGTGEACSHVQYPVTLRAHVYLRILSQCAISYGRPGKSYFLLVFTSQVTEFAAQPHTTSDRVCCTTSHHK